MNYNEEESAWNPDDRKYGLLKLTDSKRVSQPIADIIKNVAVNKYKVLSGQSNVNLKPVIILFDEHTKSNVLQKYAELTISKNHFSIMKKNLYMKFHK
ncbi:hypothetical protein [Tenuifilum thalassicum]|nr:hypothetical protein [Tenuifilum thalassicum]